jgi:hypothetical protein
VALSNAAELINLGRIADYGGRARRKLHLADICALAASRWRTHIPAIDPVDGSGRPGAAIWKKVSGCDGSNGRTSPGRNPVSHGDFERLCHVAINTQI